MIRSKFIFFITLLTFSYSLLFSQENEMMMDSIPFGAIIQSELGGKRSKFYGNTRFTLNQAYFSNWISGGESSITGLFGMDYNYNYSDRNGLIWDTNFLLSLGATYIKGNDYTKKTDDRIEINSLIGKQINRLSSYSVYVNLKTQLRPGYNYPVTSGEEFNRERISEFFSPAIIQGGFGLYIKKEPIYWINMSPLAARVIIVNSSYTKNLSEDQKYFGVDPNKVSKFFFGASVTGNIKFNLVTNVTLENKFNTYINYLEKTKNIDIDWNMDFRFKVNDKISSNLIIHFIYDDDLIKKLQIRELFGLGINIDL